MLSLLSPVDSVWATSTQGHAISRVCSGEAFPVQLDLSVNILPGHTQEYASMVSLDSTKMKVESNHYTIVSIAGGEHFHHGRKPNRTGSDLLVLDEREELAVGHGRPWKWNGAHICT